MDTPTKLLLGALPTLGRTALTRELGALEPEDFRVPQPTGLDVVGAELAAGLTSIAGTTPEIGNRSLTLQLLHRHHLDAGDMEGTKGRQIKSALSELASSTVDAVMVPTLIFEVIEARFRREFRQLAATMLDRSHTSPLTDLDATLSNGVPELRRLRARIKDPGRLAHDALLHDVLEVPA